MKKLLALSITALLALNTWASEFKDITIKELKTSIAEKKVVLLDVNGTESYKEGHIPGAINFEQNEAKLASVLPKDKNALIVAYCGGPKCSAYLAAANAASKLGYKNVRHLTAGISGWKEAGEKTQSAS